MSIVERRTSLEGYELYLVEQWVCSRRSPTIVITTYTGDPNHSIVAGVLAIPEDEREWPPRLALYFKAMYQYHARPKDSLFGEIMVTNLSSFPSALTVIAVRDGNIRRHRQEFIVNEDLKRLGCLGRSGLTLTEPTRATQEKFFSLYKTNENISFSDSVLELIKQCQTALFIFGMLEAKYVDGLLCDVTETAIGDWWTEVGAEYYNAEPSDGILGPTTVAALLGLLMGARNRLAWYGTSVSKDVFDVDNMKKAIGSFQKDYKLERTRRLDHQTLRRLHSVTIKAAAGEGGWGVQRAIKSTVEGFGGKRGELVFGMVGGKDKGNIGDIETLDMDKFISLIFGERPKWLWFGKSRKSLAMLPAGAEHFQDRAAAAEVAAGGSFGRDDVPPSANQRPLPAPIEGGGDDNATADGESSQPKRDGRATIYSAAPPESAISIGEIPVDRDRDRDRDPRKRAVFKSVAGRVSDARSGLGRIRDAVGGGLRGHTTRPSRDDTMSSALFGPDAYSSIPSATQPGIANLAQASLNSPVMVGRAFTWKNKPEEYLNSMRGDREYGEGLFKGTNGTDADVAGTAGLPTGSQTGPQYADSATMMTTATTATTPASAAIAAELASRARRYAANSSARNGQFLKELVSMTNTSVAGSVADDSDLEGPILEAERTVGQEVVGLLRRHSIAGDHEGPPHLPFEVVWPRRLSFSTAEEAMLTWSEIVEYADADVNEEAVDESGDDTVNRAEKSEKSASKDDVDRADGNEDENERAGGNDDSDDDGGNNNYDPASLPPPSAADLATLASALARERDLYSDLAALKDRVTPLVLGRVLALEALDGVYEKQVGEVQNMYFDLKEAFERVEANSQELLGGERAHAAEAVRELEALLARVEYEIGSLVTKVQDVEEGVRQFSRQVEYVERRADELQQQLETESWLHWFVRSVTGIGTGPNIVGGPRAGGLSS